MNLFGACPDELSIDERPTTPSHPLALALHLCPLVPNLGQPYRQYFCVFLQLKLAAKLEAETDSEFAVTLIIRVTPSARLDLD